MIQGSVVNQVCLLVCVDHVELSRSCHSLWYTAIYYSTEYYSLPNVHNPNSLRKPAYSAVAYLTIKLTTDQGCHHSSFLGLADKWHTHTHTPTQSSRLAGVCIVAGEVGCGADVESGKESGLAGSGMWQQGRLGKGEVAISALLRCTSFNKKGIIHQLREMNKGQTGKNDFTLKRAHTHTHMHTVWPPTHWAHCSVCSNQW